MSVITLPATGGPSALRPGLPIGARAVTPSDVSTFSVPVAIRVGGAGNIVVSPASGEADVTLNSVPAGETLPFLVRAVKATGTTATNITAIY